MTLSRMLTRALMRPWLLASMLRAAWRFRARRWWRRPPFLPLPPRDYVEWRMHTAYGDDGRLPSPAEMRRYLRWANRMHGGRRREMSR
jgi:hypothetical protein